VSQKPRPPDNLLGRNLTIEYGRILTGQAVAQGGVDKDERLVSALGKCTPDQFEVVETRTPLGGGASPGKVRQPHYERRFPRRAGQEVASGKG
jgi:hypothetical protein